MSGHRADTIDLADIVRSLRRGMAALVSFIVLGTVAAIAVLLWAPRKFDSAASLVIRSSPSQGSLLQSAGDLTSLLGGSAASHLETEIAILQSRAVAEPIIDSLALQVRVRAPARVPARALLARVALGGSFKTVRYTLDRAANGYTVRGPGGSAIAHPGKPLTLADAAGGSITLRADTTLPSHLELQLLDPEDAAQRFAKSFSAAKAGGDVVRLAFQADDSLTAARVPNAVATAYLALRHTTDRGVNQHRVEFLVPRVDSAAAALTAAEDALRRQQERSDDIDPTTAGRVAITQLADLRGQIYTLDIEHAAIDSLLQRVDRNQVSPRDVAALPTFIKSSAISALVSQLSQLDAERLKLLANRTPENPDVQALTQSISAVQAQLVPIGRSYAASVATQRAGLQRAMDSLHTALAAMPRDLEASGRLEADIKRLGTEYTTLETQLIQARLAAISEGGDARQLDVATPPKRPSFPQPVSTLGIGVGGGLLVGLVAALFLSAVGQWARDPLEVERLAGVPAMRLDAAEPLILGGQAARTVLILPLDPLAPTAQVAAQLAETSLARLVNATVLDLTGAAQAANPNETIARLEQEFGHVVVRLPEITSKTTVAALNPDRPVLIVAAPGRVHKTKLNAMLGALRRMNVPCAGVIMPPPASARVLVRA